ncbi:MAG: hypothetical protein QOF17_712 [Solirubrobacteraceae bacterium]|jgi:hypothetical protein|nr:hypothetical protein [Solirubrobacteraceae bacterium]
MSIRIEEHDAGVSWTVREAMARTSHALADGGRVWLIDPVDDAEALAAAQARGRVAGVIQLLDRHPRDAAALAERYGVPHLRLPGSVPDSPFEVVPVLDRKGWREVALWWPQRRALVVAETIGTSPFYALDHGPAGIHALIRLRPPGVLRGYPAEHLLVGHGRARHGSEAAIAIEHAYRHARRDIPRLLAAIPRWGLAARGRSAK